MTACGPGRGRVLFREWAERWDNTTAALRPNTCKEYQTLPNSQVLPAFGDMTLLAIGALAVREWVAEWPRPRPRSPASWSGAVSVRRGCPAPTGEIWTVLVIPRPANVDRGGRPGQRRPG
jgi:hypothetical protein